MHTCRGNGFETPHKGHRREGGPTLGSCCSDGTRSSLLALPNLGVADFHIIVPDLPSSGHFVSCGREEEVLLPAAVPSTANCGTRAAAHTQVHSLHSARPLPLSRSSVEDALPPSGALPWRWAKVLVGWNQKMLALSNPKEKENLRLKVTAEQKQINVLLEDCSEFCAGQLLLKLKPKQFIGGQTSACSPEHCGWLCLVLAMWESQSAWDCAPA